MSSLRILFVDRHTGWLEFAEKTLKQAGYVVITAIDLYQAYQHCLDEDFDLIFIGLDQAESYLGTLSDLAKNPGHPQRFVVMFPILQTFARVRIVLKAGAYDVVDKPYQHDALLKMVADEVREARRGNNLALAANDREKSTESTANQALN